MPPTIVNASFVDPGEPPVTPNSPVHPPVHSPVHPVQKIQFIRAEPELIPDAPSNIPFDDWREYSSVCLINADQTENLRLANHIAGKKFSGTGYLVTDRPKKFQGIAHLNVLSTSYVPALLNAIESAMNSGSTLSHYIIIDYSDDPYRTRDRDAERALMELSMNGRHMRVSTCFMLEPRAHLRPNLRCNMDYVFLKCCKEFTRPLRERHWTSYYGMLTKTQFTDLYDAHEDEYMVMSARADCNNSYSALEAVKFMKWK